MRLAIILFFLPGLVFGQKAVFTSGADGYKSFRIPALVRLPDGRVLAFCEGRRKGAADFGDNDIVMRSSSDDGQTWSALRVVVDYDTLQASNAAPVVDLTDPAYPKGRLFLFYNTGNVPENEIRKGVGVRQVWYVTSVDGGMNWSSPVNITAMVKRAGWRSYANTPGHAIQFMSGRYRGRIYVAANHSTGDPQPHFKDYQAHGFYTDDHGVSFHISEDVSMPGGNENMAAELGGGGLMLNLRNQQGNVRSRIVALSHDGGNSWDTTFYDQRLPDPVCQGSLLSVGGGRVLVFCNDASMTRRDSLSMRVSVDSGRSWGPVMLVDGGGVGDHTGYCDLVDLGAGNIGVLYERDNYHEIIFTEIDGIAVAASKLTRLQWDAVEGIYQLAGNPNMFIRFTDRDGELLARFLWEVNTEFHFLPDSGLVFLRKDNGLGLRPRIRFRRDAMGRVVHVTMGNGTEWYRVEGGALGSGRLKELGGKYQSVDDRDNKLVLTAGDSTLIVKQVWDGKEYVLTPLSGSFFFSAQPYYTLQIDFPDKGEAPESVKVMARYTFLFTGR